MTARSGFSERVFEFAFNAEFAATHRAIVVGCPDIPTQRQEKKRAYDVNFQLRQRGGAIGSLFLQHKVVRHVSSRGGSNAARYDTCKGPYFVFDIDVDQYNVIRNQRGRGKAFYFCAPAFIDRGALETHYGAGKVVTNSLWIDVVKAPFILDHLSHSILVDESGSVAFRTSTEFHVLETRRISPIVDDLGIDQLSEGLDVGVVRELYGEIATAIRERQRPLHSNYETEMDTSWMRIQEGWKPDSVEDGIEEISRLAARELGLSWLLVTKQ